MEIEQVPDASDVEESRILAEEEERMYYLRWFHLLRLRTKSEGSIGFVAFF